MECNGPKIKSKTRIFAENHSIILEVQQSWQQIEKMKAAIMKSKDRALGLKIQQQLQDFLCRLETVKELNPILQDSKHFLVKDINMFKKLLENSILRRKSCIEFKQKLQDSAGKIVLRRYSCVVGPEPHPQPHAFAQDILEAPIDLSKGSVQGSEREGENHLRKEECKRWCRNNNKDADCKCLDMCMVKLNC